MARALSFTRRAKRALRATTTLSPDECMAAVAEAAALHSAALGRRESIELDRHGAWLSVPLVRYPHWSLAPEGPPGAQETAWRAAVDAHTEGSRTSLRVGGLSEYWTLPPGPLTPWFALPGIKPIWRFVAFEDFLWRVAERIRARDPDAVVVTDVPPETLGAPDRLTDLGLRAAQATPLAGLALYTFVVFLVARELAVSAWPLLAAGIAAMPFVRGARHHLVSPTTARQPRTSPARLAVATSAFTICLVAGIGGAVRLGRHPAAVLVLGISALPLFVLDRLASARDSKPRRAGARRTRRDR